MASTEEIRQLLYKELPGILEKDDQVLDFILPLSRQHFADKDRTEDRIERLLDELKIERERQDRKWDEQGRRWEKQNRRSCRIPPKNIFSASA